MARVRAVVARVRVVAWAAAVDGGAAMWVVEVRAWAVAARVKETRARAATRAKGTVASVAKGAVV